MSQLSLGVLATSSKENEFRLPIHPQHFDRIDADLRARIFLERLRRPLRRLREASGHPGCGHSIP